MVYKRSGVLFTISDFAKVHIIGQLSQYDFSILGCLNTLDGWGNIELSCY